MSHPFRPPVEDKEDTPLYGRDDRRDGGDDEGCGPFYAENRPCILCCLGFVFLISIVLLALSFDVVKPTEYGLLQNGWTGWVYTDDVYLPGRHFVWLRNFFITFPAYRVSIEFSTSYNTTSPPVPARTGRDLSDPDSGGQPVSLSFSFQYQFKQGDIGKVYEEFGEQYEARYLLFARMAVSDVAQKYTPDKFWNQRAVVAEDMFNTLRSMLRVNGHCDVTAFQLLQVDFPDKYEDMITDIQLQVQYKLTSEYQQEVTNVMKDIDVLTAETQAQVTAIRAAAAATSSLLINEAKTEGFYAQQTAKAESYAAMKAQLSMTTQEMLDYVKIRALTDGRPSAQTVVGTTKPSLVGS